MQDSGLGFRDLGFRVGESLMIGILKQESKVNNKTVTHSNVYV